MHLRALLSLVLFLLLVLTGEVIAQGNTQTIRGSILDTDTRQPMIGATVVVMGSDPILGTTTDVDGRFAINAVPTGRVDLQIRMIGFEEQRMPNLLLTSAKELVLEVRMQVKDFMITHSDKDQQEYKEFIGKLQAALDDSHRRRERIQAGLRELADERSRAEKDWCEAWTATGIKPLPPGMAGNLAAIAIVTGLVVTSLVYGDYHQRRIAE